MLKQTNKVRADIRIKNQWCRMEARKNHPGNPDVWTLPPGMGTGRFVHHHLPMGLGLTFSACRLYRDLEARLNPGGSGITLAFALEGTTLNLPCPKEDATLSLDKGFSLEKGTACLYRFSQPAMTRRAGAGQTLKALVLSIPRENAGRLWKDAVPPEWSETDFFKKIRISPEARGLIHQLSHPLFKGPARQVFMEAKALELAAHTLDRIHDTSGVPDGVTPEEADRIFRARDLLVRDLRNPPSLRELARAAAMSHPRFNRAFAMIFGTTAFAYLRICRLERARQLILENRMNLTRIAHDTGFSGSSHFGRAFLARYGMPPGKFKTRVLDS